MACQRKCRKVADGVNTGWSARDLGADEDLEAAPEVSFGEAGLKDEASAEL